MTGDGWEKTQPKQALPQLWKPKENVWNNGVLPGHGLNHGRHPLSNFSCFMASSFGLREIMGIKGNDHHHHHHHHQHHRHHTAPANHLASNSVSNLSEQFPAALQREAALRMPQLRKTHIPQAIDEYHIYIALAHSAILPLWMLRIAFGNLLIFLTTRAFLTSLALPPYTQDPRYNNFITWDALAWTELS